jgi:hypothetical protein
MQDVMAEFRERARRIQEALAASPEVDITGLVTASGASGSQAGNSAPWSLGFTFCGWRVGGGELRVEDLYVRKEMLREELAGFRVRLPAYAIVRVRARLAQVPGVDRPQALLLEIVETGAADAGLARLAAALRQPVTLDDPLLGTFTLDRQINWFAGEALWNGGPVQLHLVPRDADGVGDAGPFLATAHALWSDQAGWHRRALDCAAEKLLALKNDNWLGDDETVLDAGQFRARLALESVSAYADGSFEFWFADGDLFWGHSITVSGSLAEGLVRADIAG